MKNKIEIKNLLDQRYKRNQDFQRWFNKYTLAALVDGIILGSLFGLFIADNPYKQVKLDSPNDGKSMIEVKAVEVTSNEVPCDYDPITYLRCKGTQLGIKDTEITKIIATMKCESGLRPDALNKNSNGTFDVGIGQINDVHSKRISRQDRMDFVKNIDFIYTLYQEQGLNPWVCARKLGYIK